MENTFGIDIIPFNDQERIAALHRYKILDTPAEESFDHIAQLATEIFDVPISEISFIDQDNVFIKGNAGMANPKYTSRGISLCSLSILNEEITVFEDTLKIPFLLANPLVTGDFGLRFYAGAPLITNDGYSIGTICIIDKKPGTFTKKDEALLQHLARVAMDVIESRLTAIGEGEKQQLINSTIQSLSGELTRAHSHLKKTREKLAESESRFRSMIDQSSVAMMVTSGTNLVVDAINPIMLEILGNKYHILGKPLFDTFPELDSQGFKELIYDVYETGKPFYATAAPVTLIIDGIEQLKYFNLAYTPIREEGKINAVLQVAIEVTEQIANFEKLKKAEELLLRYKGQS